MYEAKVSWIFFAMLVLAVAWGFWLKTNEAPEPERKPEWALIDDKLVEKETKELFQGEREMPFQDAPSMIQWVYTYVDGVRQGAATEFFPGPFQKVRTRANYVDGVRHGPVSTYHLNGVKQSEATVVNGRTTGLVTFFKEDGTVDRREVFEDSFPSGAAAITAVPELIEQVLPERDQDLVLEIDENVEPPLILDMEGKPFTGTQVGTFHGGAKAFEHSYKDGRLHGEHVAWYPAGNLEYQRPHHDGKKHGTWRHWATGKFLVSEDHFQHGKQVGSAKRWYAQSEQLRLESQFVHGAEHGARKIFDRAGREVRQLLFDHGIQVGVVEAGTPISESPLPDGLTLTVEGSEEAGVHFIEFESLREEFEGLAVVDFRFRLSTSNPEPPAGASRPFRVSVLVNGEAAEVADFAGDLGGWIVYKERVEIDSGAVVKLQIDVQPGDQVIDFAGVRFRDVAAATN